MERGGFDPPKAFAGRFTVCSLWPLGHLSSSVLLPRSPADGRSRTGDLLITSQPLYRLSYIGAPPALGFIESTNRDEDPPRSMTGAAPDRSWRRDTITAVDEAPTRNIEYGGCQGKGPPARVLSRP